MFAATTSSALIGSDGADLVYPCEDERAGVLLYLTHTLVVHQVWAVIVAYRRGQDGGLKRGKGKGGKGNGQGRTVIVEPVQHQRAGHMRSNDIFLTRVGSQNDLTDRTEIDEYDSIPVQPAV